MISLFSKCVFEFIGTLVLVLLGDSGSSYNWVPVLGPLAGAALATALFLILF